MTDIEKKNMPVLQSQETEMQIPAPVFSEQDEREIAELASLIDFNKSNSIIEYGVDFMKSYGNFSSDTLKKYRSSDLGEIEKELLDIYAKLKVEPLDEEKLPKNLIARLGKKVKHFGQETAVKTEISFASMDTILTDTEAKFSEKKDWLSMAIAEMDRMYEYNQEYRNLLLKYIEGAKRNLEKGRAELPAKLAHAQASNDSFEAQKVTDFSENINDLEQKIINFNTMKDFATTLAIEIRLAQKTFKNIAKGINNLITESMPQWQQGIHLRLLAEEGRKSADLLKKGQELTQNIAKANADIIRDLVVDSTYMVGRPTYEHETIEYVIDTIQSAIESQLEITKTNMAELRDGEQRVEAKNAEFQGVLYNYSKELGTATIQNALGTSNPKKYKYIPKKM